MGSPDDASSRSRSSPDHQPGGECEQATGATVQNDRGVPISFDGDTLYEPTGGLPAAEAVHRLSREQKASQRQIQTSLGQNKTSSSGLAEKLPKTGNLSNRKGTRFRVFGIAVHVFSVQFLLECRRGERFRQYACRVLPYVVFVRILYYYHA